MARDVRRMVRGTRAQVAAYTGPSGETVYNTDDKRVHVQDGGTPGGSALAPERVDGGRLNFEYPTIAAAKASRITSDQRTVTVSGAVVENVGRAKYKRSSTAGAGAGRWQNDIDGQWWEIIPISLSLAQLGALPGSSAAILAANLAAVQAAAQLTKVVRLDESITVASTTDMLSYMDLTIVGRGKIDGLYRKQVIPDLAISTAPQTAGDVLTAEHFPTSSRMRNNVEVGIGDSIFSDSANTFGHACMLGTVLPKELYAQARKTGRKIQWYNRSIGGAGWPSVNGNIQSTPTRVIEWASTELRLWLKYVEDLKPTRVWFSFGMNPPISIKAILAAFNTVRSWRFPDGLGGFYTPDIVFLTPLVPRPYVGPGNPVDGTANSPAALEARDQAAGLIRTYGRWLGVPVLDPNRMQNRAVFGFDPTEGQMERSFSKTTIANGASGTRQALGYSVRWRLDPTKLAANGSTPIRLNTGPGSSDIIEIVATSTANVYNIVMNAGDGSDLLTIDITNGVTILPPQDQTFDLVFELLPGGYGLLYILGTTFEGSYGETKGQIWSSNIVSRGGLFTPTITCAAAGAINVLGFDYFAPTIVRPTLSITELFNDGIDNSLAGSPINHPSNRAEAHIWGPVIKNVQFFAADPFRLTGPRALSYVDAAGVTRSLGLDDAGAVIPAGGLRMSGSLRFSATDPAPRWYPNGSGGVGWAMGGATDMAYGEIRSTGLMNNISGGFQATGHYLFAADNAFSIASAGNRARDIFSANPVTTTSDAREKLDRAGNDLVEDRVSPFTDAEIAWACALDEEIGLYRFKASCAEKGADARLHVGMTVQRAITLGRDLGLDPMAYGFICYDSWDAIEPEDAVFAEVENGQDADGKPIMVTMMVRPATPGRPAGDHYGFREGPRDAFINAGVRAALRKARTAA